MPDDTKLQPAIQQAVATGDSSHIRMLKRFASFWSNVSSIHIARGVPHDTQAAVVRGFDRAYGTEKMHGREDPA